MAAGERGSRSRSGGQFCGTGGAPGSGHWRFLREGMTVAPPAGGRCRKRRGRKGGGRPRTEHHAAARPFACYTQKPRRVKRVVAGRAGAVSASNGRDG